MDCSHYRHITKISKDGEPIKRLVIAHVDNDSVDTTIRCIISEEGISSALIKCNGIKIFIMDPTGEHNDILKGEDNVYNCVRVIPNDPCLIKYSDNCVSDDNTYNYGFKTYKEMLTYVSLSVSNTHVEFTRTPTHLNCVVKLDDKIVREDSIPNSSLL